MRRTTRILVCLAIGMLPIGSQQCFGDNAPAKKRTKPDYAKLVSQLASPNQKPTVRANFGDEHVDFPGGYDVKAQKGIEAIRKLLQDNVEEALPSLVSALDDKRYCMTISWGEGQAFISMSVGEVCRDVIASHLEVYRDKIGFSDPHQWLQYDYPITKKWWEKHKRLKLSQLQIEAIKWAIERRKADLEEYVKKHRADLDNTYIERIQQSILELATLSATIAKSGKPAKPRGLLPMVTNDR